MLLDELDRRGRVRGAFVCEVEEALDYLREMDSDHPVSSRERRSAEPV